MSTGISVGALRRALVLALGMSLAMSAYASPTGLDIDSGSATESGAATTLSFPLTRSEDTGYDLYLRYHTVDGSAVGGVDYTAATNGSLTLAAGAGSDSISIGIPVNTTAGADKNFQLVLDSAVGVGPAASLAVQEVFATGDHPCSVVAADLNGDGKLDLIVVNTDSNTVSVLRNTTAPGATVPHFAAQQTFAVGDAPQFVAVADLNGDGKPDLIVANYSGTVSVLRNTTVPGHSTFSFAAQQQFAVGSGPVAVAVADINGDGLPDLIVVNHGDNTVAVLRNRTATGHITFSFAAPQTFATGSGPNAVAVADVNGDGKPDLIVSNGGDANVSVLRNTTVPGHSTLSFAAQQTFATGNEPSFVAAADINGDGKPDLIVTNASDYTVSVLSNTTTTGATALHFATQRAFAAGTVPESVTVVDINGDGRPDLIVASADDYNVSVLSNRTAPGGVPAFAARQTFATGAVPLSVAVADLNGDGKPDVIAVNSNDNTVSVLLNTVSPNATTLALALSDPSFDMGAAPYLLATADLNGDGKPDLIATNFNAGTVSVRLNTTVPGASTPSFAAQQTFATGNFPSTVVTADVNGDGRPDLIVTDGDDGTVSVLLNTTVAGATTPSFAAQQTFATGVVPTGVAAVDVNGDGRPDLIVANKNGDTVSVLLNTTAPGATAPSFATQQTFATGSKPAAVVTADVNGDGLPDMIVMNSGDNTVSVLLNTTAPGATTPSFAAEETFATGSSPTAVVTADLNGDGLPDLIVTNSADNTVSVLLNTTAPGATTPSFAAQHTFATGSYPTAVATADLNGDGLPDLIVSNGSDNTVSILRNTTARGATTPGFAAQQTVYLGSSTSPYAVAAADFNGDGQTDVVAANFGNATVAVLLNTRYEATLSGSPATGTIHFVGDTTPDAFSFTAITGAPLNTTETSNTITVAGINTAAPISIVGGRYSVNGGAYTSSAGTVALGDMVAVRKASATTASTTSTATLTIGGVSAGFSVTTAP